MNGLANLALGSAPVAGGFLLAVATGQLKSPGPLKAPNYRVMIQQDQEILRGIPEDQVTRRTELQHTIDVRIDDLISAIATGRSFARRLPPTRATGATSWPRRLPCSGRSICSSTRLKRSIAIIVPSKFALCFSPSRRARPQSGIF